MNEESIPKTSVMVGNDMPMTVQALEDMIPDTALYPSLSDTDRRLQAYRMYMTDHRSYREISEAIGVPVRTVVTWGQMGGWATRRKDTDLAYKQDLERATSIYALQEKIVEMRGLLVASRELRDLLTRKIEILKQLPEAAFDERATAAVLAKLAETLAGIANTSSKAVGLSENGPIQETPAEKEKGKKQFVVALNFQQNPEGKTLVIEADEEPVDSRKVDTQ